MIRSLSLRTWMLMSHVLVLLLPVLVIVGTGILAKELRYQTQADLENQAALLELLARDALTHLREDAPQAGLAELGPRLGPTLIEARTATLAGIRVVDHEGIVVASSGDELGEDLSGRPEVHAALEGAVSLDLRPRPTPTRNHLGSVSRRATVRLFLGVPLRYEGQTVGAVVLSRTPREEMQALYQALPWWAVVLPTALTAIMALLAGYFFSRSLTRLTHASSRVAEGDFRALDALDHTRASRVLEVRQLTASFDTMTRRLQERLHYISEFAGNVSHEFKTPISTLKGTLELLADDEDMPAEQRARFLDNASAELLRLERLVTGLLRLARAEEAEDRRQVDLDSLCREIAERYPRVEVSGSASKVRGSAEQLAAVIDNLVDNAHRYGGEEVSVRIGLAAGHGKVRITVTDDGPGIAAGNLPQVFDRFFTTSRGAGGTGLGLALARTVMLAHGGSIDGRSKPGQTVFTTELPAE